VSSFPARIDRPADDGNPCTEAACDIDLPKQLPKPAGTRCGEEGICNGAGVCGVCLPGKEQCDGNAVIRCDAEGQWSEPEACTVKQPLCSQAKCIGVVQLATGRSHACARFDDGSLRCWGANHRGQLGDGGLSQARSPTWSTAISALAFGPRHACGVNAGRAWCWGANDYGQLGQGSYVSSNSPAPTPLSDVAEVAVGLHHSCARTTAGEVHCWGRTDRGQLGSGKRVAVNEPELALEAAGAPRPKPVAIVGLPQVAGVTAGWHHTCVQSAGTPPRCWGLRPFDLPEPIDKPERGEDGSPPDADAVKRYEALTKLTQPQPTPVAGLKDAQQIACGHRHCCARLAAGTVSCWGAGQRGQLGRAAGQDSFKPVVVEGLADTAHIALGADFGCALLTGGKVSCWGANQVGQLGTGSAAKTGKATVITSLPEVASLHVGEDFACVLAVEGSVHCWGLGSMGQLGPAAANVERAPTTVVW
jgi:alpha-tubulin suppressor-like RCC1 family protein